MKVRFDRVSTFLDYLTDEEDAERRRFELDRLGRAISEPIVDRIRTRFDSDRAYIERRVRENRERYQEDIQFDWDESELLSVEYEESTPDADEQVEDDD